MALFFVQHTHSPENCPARDPAQGNFLLEHLDPQNARSHGVKIVADAVIDGKHTFNLIVESEDQAAVRTFLAPFERAGSLEINPASHCEKVVGRGGC